MLKSIQIKIVMIFTILGIIVITSLGFFSLYKLSDIVSYLNVGMETGEYITNQAEQIRIAIYCSIGAFIVCAIILSFVITKVVLAPISKLVKSAENIARGKYLGDGKNNKVENKNEFDDLADAFGIMNQELKENLNEVTRQKKQIETILLHMTDGIIAFNIKGKIIHINHAAKTYLNVDENQTFEEIFNQYDVDINMEKIIYLENWTSSERKIQVNDKTMNLFFASFKNENDRPSGIMVVIQDITEHVKLDSMRKEFVADVSHELKTPITSIMGYSDTLLQSNVPENKQKNFLKRISDEANRMSELVTDLLTLSRYDNSTNVNKEEFDLGDLVKQTVDRLKFEFEKKKQEAECLITADVPMVYADRNGIERVILNIISNSIKYTPDGGMIKIYVGFVYNDAYIKVIDNGIGIPKEDIEKVFERFYRVDKSRTREMGGTGLRTSNSKRDINSKCWKN